MKINVYKGQYGYSTLCKNGEDKVYLQVQFKREMEPTEERLRIDIKDGFFSAYKNKNGVVIPKLVVMQYEIEGEQNNNMSEDNFDDPLPF